MRKGRGMPGNEFEKLVTGKYDIESYL